MIELLPFQKRFLRAAAAPGVSVAALSLPRGGGKTTLLAREALQSLIPSNESSFVPGAESYIISGSLGQGRRTIFRQMKAMLGDAEGYRIADSENSACSITHKKTGTRVTVLAANHKTTWGLVGVPRIFCDEPGAWEVTGGERVSDAIFTSLGKPGSEMKVMLCGTLAPALRGWWHGLVDSGSGPGRHVTLMRGDAKKWDQWSEIKRVNPLLSRFPEGRATLKRELDRAKADPRLKARFLSYRLNLPSADESEMLLTVENWQTVIARPVAERQGRPVVGVDLGAGRAWSAAVAIWPSGRVEAIAVGPGVPSISEQERRDQVPAGTYRKLCGGALTMADGLRVPPPAMLIARIGAAWGVPALIVCDRFRLSELQDCCRWPIEPRVSRWSEAAFDIRAVRKLALDGGMTVAPESVDLLGASLSAAIVKNDDAGNTRLEKRGTHNQARDDVAAAMVLVCGALERRGRTVPGMRYHGLAG